MGVWGQSPQRGPGAKPLVKGLGGASLPEAESYLALGRPKGCGPLDIIHVEKNILNFIKFQ